MLPPDEDECPGTTDDVVSALVDVRVAVEGHDMVLSNIETLLEKILARLSER